MGSQEAPGPIKSKEFEECPPVVTPTVVKLKVPCAGGDSESFKINVKNTSYVERLTFKTRGTKQKYFKVSPTKGFIEPSSTCVITVTPKCIETSVGFNRFDHFAIYVAPATKDKTWDAKAIWEPGSPMEPKQLQRFQVKLRLDDPASTTNESTEEDDDEQ